MSYKNNIMSVAIAILLASTTLSAAKAGDAEDIKRLAGAEVSLSAAVTLAEEKQNGKAVEAELDEEKGVVVYDVKVVKDNTFYDVQVDARNGDILKVEEDKN